MYEKMDKKLDNVTSRMEKCNWGRLAIVAT